MFCPFEARVNKLNPRNSSRMKCLHCDYPHKISVNYAIRAELENAREAGQGKTLRDEELTKTEAALDPGESLVRTPTLIVGQIRSHRDNANIFFLFLVSYY
jgi:hypothetical protein